MSLLSHLTPTEQQLLGPNTIAYLALDHSAHNSYRLRELVGQVLTVRNPDSAPLERPTGYLSGPLALLLGNVLDSLKAGTLPQIRADQYRTEGRATDSPDVMLRLLVKLHLETNPSV